MEAALHNIYYPSRFVSLRLLSVPRLGTAGFEYIGREYTRLYL